MTSLISRANGYFRSVLELRQTRLKANQLEHKFNQLFNNTSATVSNGAGRTNTGKDTRKPRVLLSENFHLNQRSFGALHEFLKVATAKVSLGIKRGTPTFDLMKANGVYCSKDELIATHFQQLSQLEPESLRHMTVRDTELFRIVKDELLCATIHKAHWQEHNVVKDEDAIFRIAWDLDRETLLCCYAAALYWFEYWSELPAIGKHSHAVLFSGSRIYCKTLMHILRHTPTRCFVAETFMTGHHFYLEHRYTPIPNNSSSKWLWGNSQSEIGSIPADLSRQRAIDVHNAFRTAKNKNVQQPPEKAQPPSSFQKHYLVLGQVINDYSLISGCGTILTSLPAYKKIIEILLRDPEAFITFKAHPWEAVKFPEEGNKTYNYLTTWTDKLKKVDRERITIVVDVNLQQLFRKADSVITLCSQGAIEAALEGFKPITVGGAFYDRAGFTTNLKEPRELEEFLQAGPVGSTLSLENYEALQDYLSFMLFDHLVPASSKGTAKVAQIFQDYASVPHAKSSLSEVNISPEFMECNT